MKEINICSIRKCSKCVKKTDGSCNGCSLCDVAFCRCNKEKLSRCLVRCPRKLGTFHNIEIVKDTNILLANSHYKLPGYIPIMPDKVRQEFDFSKVNNTVGIHGEFLLAANGENILNIYKMRGI